MSLRDEVAKRVRVKLARQPSAPTTAESFGSLYNMRKVVNTHLDPAARHAHQLPFLRPPGDFEEDWTAEDADHVRSSPAALHFVAHHPGQLSPQEGHSMIYDPQALDASADDDEPVDDDGAAPPGVLRYASEDDAPVDVFGQPTGPSSLQQIRAGQGRVRRMMGYPARPDGAEPTVFFKSHRAARLAALLTGGHVESVSFSPKSLATLISHTAKFPAGSNPRFVDLRSRSGPPGTDLAPSTPSHDPTASATTAIASHPVFGEHVTRLGDGIIPLHGDYTNMVLHRSRLEPWMDPYNPHRGVCIHNNRWEVPDEVAHNYGNPPQHLPPPALDSHSEELLAQALSGQGGPLTRAVLADHLDESGQHEHADAWRQTLPQQFSRRGEKTRLAEAVADRARAKLARQPVAPMTADSFGHVISMSRTPAAHMGVNATFTHPHPTRKDYFGFAETVTDSTDAVRKSPSTLHFVAHDPDQLSPMWTIGSESPYYAGTRLVAVMDRGKLAWQAPDSVIRDRDPQRGGDDVNPLIEHINSGQGMVRRLLRIPQREDGHEPTVYFKSYRSARLAALLTGGHVETVAFDPKVVAKFIKRTSNALPSAVQIYDRRGGKEAPNYQDLARAGVLSAVEMNDHPVFGEYMTNSPGLPNPINDIPDERLWKGDLAHRHAVLGHTGIRSSPRWTPDEDILKNYGHPPVHFDPGILDDAGRQIHAQVVANPGDHLARAVLADHLDSLGHQDHADSWRQTIPQQFSRRGEKLRLSAAVAERVRVRLARKAGQPMTADSLGGTAEMKAAGQGEYDNSYGIPFASSPSAEEVRKSPHVLHFVAHHPLQAAPPRIGNLPTPRAPIFDLQAPGGIGRYLPTDDPSSEAIRQGQEAVRSLLGLHSHRADTPTVFFKSYKGARLAAALTGGHVDSIALRPAGLARYIERTRKAVNRAVKMDNSHELMDEPLAIIDLRPEPDGSPGKIAKALGSMPSQPDFIRDIHTANYGAFGDERDLEYEYDDPWVINRHDVFGEYITNPYGNAARDLPTDVALPHTAHRASIHHHAGIVPNSDGFTPIATPEAETAFHRLNREYPSAAHPLWHEGHSVPGQQMPITPEEAAEMAREHWATILEHASAERPLVLAGMHVPTRQHVEALGPDAQHLWALQRDPVARLALSDLLEERGHDEMAHFMRATVPLQYARKKRDAVNQPEPPALPPADMAPIPIDTSKKLDRTGPGCPSFVVTHRSQIEPVTFGGVRHEYAGQPREDLPMSRQQPASLSLWANDWRNVGDYLNGGLSDAWDHRDRSRWFADPPSHTVLLNDLLDRSPDNRVLDRPDRPHSYDNLSYVFREWDGDHRYDNLTRALHMSKQVSDILGIDHTHYSHVHFADRGAAESIARQIGHDAHVLEIPFRPGHVRTPVDVISENLTADAPLEMHHDHPAYGGFAVVRGTMSTRSELASHLADLTEMASEIAQSEEDDDWERPDDDDGEEFDDPDWMPRGLEPGTLTTRVPRSDSYDPEDYRRIMREIWHHILSPHAQPHLRDIMFDLAPMAQLSAINSDPVARELLHHAIFDHRNPLKRSILAERLDELGHAEAADWIRDLISPEEQERLRFSRRGEAARPASDAQPAILEPEIGINVNDKSQAFTEQILSGDKTIETRSRATLHPYIGQRMGLVRTGKGKAQLVGYVTIGEPKLYTTSESFDADAGSHLVGADSPFHIAKSKSGSKWGYQLLNAERIEPRPLVDGTGIPPNPRVARKLQRSSSLKSVVVQYASQKLRYAKGANPYRDGDRVDVIGIGSGNYRRESLTQPGRHEVDIYERGRMTHRATVSLDRITRTPERDSRMDENLSEIARMLSWPGESSQPTQQSSAPGPQHFSDPHDLQAGDVIRILNADDGSPIAHSVEGGADRHDVHGYELVNQDGEVSPFADRHDPSVRVIPLGPRNIHRHPHIMGTRGRMFEVVRRGDGLPDRNHTYVDSYGHQFYVGDRVEVGPIPYTVLRNVVGANPHVVLRNDFGGETQYGGRQDASGAYTIYGLHARRLGDRQPAPPGPPHNGVTETPPIQVAVRRGPTEPAFGAPPSPPPAPARQPVTTLERILNNRYPNAGAEQADKLREYFKRTYKKDVDDETIMHLLRVPRPFPGADPNHEVFDPKNIRLSFTIHGHGIGADASSTLLGYRFNTDTDISHDSVYNASQSHPGMRKSDGTFAKYISTPHILRNQALAAHSLGIPTLEVSAAQSNPTFPGCSTGGLVWPSYGYTALLMHKYNGDAVDQAVSIIKRHNPSRAADGHVSFWLHDLLASPEGRAWYNESTPTHNGKRYKNVTSGRMKFLTHPDSESHKLLLEHTRKVESYASQQRDSAGEDTGSSPPA